MIASNAIAISNNVADISDNTAQIDRNANAIQGKKSLKSKMKTWRLSSQDAENI